YQGQELWTFHLVDPDNRGPVDFEHNRQLLADFDSRLAAGGSLDELARELGASPRDPRLKLFVTWRTLQFRRANARLFEMGDYEPLLVEGERVGHVCAFARRLPAIQDGQEPNTAIVIVPRLLAQLVPQQDDGKPRAPVGSVWKDTRVLLPEPFRGPGQNVFTGEMLPADSSELPLDKVLAEFPVALLSGKM
ncbi:MAG: malto-oligosyltrehalose synthase, partial [Patescibacteria group bacterium]|nr:malto-oligosyltrehalose synthase [Patescibacteria group bacterium]